MWTIVLKWSRPVQLRTSLTFLTSMSLLYQVEPDTGRYSVRHSPVTSSWKEKKIVICIYFCFLHFFHDNKKSTNTHTKQCKLRHERLIKLSVNSRKNYILDFSVNYYVMLSLLFSRRDKIISYRIEKITNIILPLLFICTNCFFFVCKQNVSLCHLLQ